jgi:hypothetical protein
MLVIARRASDGLVALPVQHADLPDGTHLYEMLTGMEEVISDGKLSLASLPTVGGQIWRVVFA